MAKWGEGDPRWIVEERPDAINVNNWHWTEKDATIWSKDKIKELFTGLAIATAEGECKIDEVSKLEGEASCQQRRGKLIYFYEWNLKLHWKGTIKGSKEKIKGSVEIPNISEENSLDEISITVSCKNEDNEGDLLKNLMRIEGEKKIREAIGLYIECLKKDFVVGMILPKKNEVGSSGGVKSGSAAPAPRSKTECASESIKRMGIEDSNVKVTKLTSKQSFKCTAEELYNALTTKELVEAFTRGPCLVEAKEKGRFELFGGNVVGEFLKLTPPTEIKMKWKFSGWPTNHYSHVTLKISQKVDMTEISLEQTDIPAQDLDRTKSGWNQYYWESIKRTFGFGATLY